MQILFHFPKVSRKYFRGLKITTNNHGRNNKEEFKLVVQGEKLLPNVDAGMCKLNATGFIAITGVRMHYAAFPM